VQRGSLKIVKNRKGVKVWRAQWRENGKGRTRILGRFSDVSRAEARLELDRIITPVNAMKVRQTGAVTLRQYAENEYLLAKSSVWKASTAATTEQIIQMHILAEIGGRALASITRKELQALLDRKAGSGLSSSVVGHVRWQLTALFNMAQGDGAVAVNPTLGLITPRCQGAVDKRTIDIETILRGQMVLGVRERLIYCLAVRDGLRPGEIVGLKVGDIQNGLISIERRIYRGKEDTPKTKDSRRRTAPTDTTAAVLAQYFETLIDLRPEAWLFPSESGMTPISYPNVYRRCIQPALASVGLSHVNFQILRRSYVTEFSDAEEDPAVRAKMAGHSVDVHENEYRQLKPDILKRAAAKMEKHLQ
jgi:integrase